ncbi:MAG: hypothetical protein OEV74_11720 [Cyclobacteriaceae bacterium]|nr:hypothetical protein [Cyclobacteriaceae bacterium]MDH4296943.1 hypothetical protein [Cyclobacteriaceae bacterium]MDH5250803.1 hypothetical protein [Cyclobacteriaceae bacterium]
MFRNSDMLRNFLSFIVQESLKEDGMALKQYSIAIHAFGRNPDFDATADPIVRIQAGRLRRNLELYYQDEAGDDTVVISLPKGSYAPTFTYLEIKDSSNHSDGEKTTKVNNSLAVFPIKDLSSERDQHYIVEGFNEELLMELTRYKELQVIRVKEEVNDRTKNSLARFSLEGSFRFSGKTVKISISVADSYTNQLLWSTQEKFNIDDSDLIQVQEDLATSVAQQIADVSGVIFEKLFADTNWEKTRSLQAYAIYMHFYKYNKNPTEKSANDLLEKVTLLVKNEPDFAPGWAVLTNLYADAYMFGLNRQFLDQALSFGIKSIELQANNQVCQAYYAYALLINDQLDEAEIHFEKALSLNPNALYYSGAIGWAYCLLGKLDEGYSLIRKSMERDFQYPKWFHMGTFLYHLNRGEYSKALIEANKLDKPDLYWSPLIKLVACYKLSLLEQSDAHLNELMEVKPNFFDHPKEYVKALVKSETLSVEILSAVDAVVKASEMSFP